jgi:MerR family redox-sensitive transcriptional activator SoxR
MTELLTIGELARRTGVTTVTLRYYDELGLVRPTQRVSGHRRYDQRAVSAVGVVRLMQEVGFSLAEMQLIQSRKRSPAAWRELAVRKAEELRHHIDSARAALELIEHSLVCPEESFRDCPTFWATVRGLLEGAEVADAHSEAHPANRDST